MKIYRGEIQTMTTCFYISAETKRDDKMEQLTSAVESSQKDSNAINTNKES